jgi:hypothetical protein
MFRLLHKTTKPRRLVTAVTALVAAFGFPIAAAFTLTDAPSASASTTQLAIIQDQSLLSSPATSLPLVRSLGVRVIRVSLPWYSLAPHPASTHEPKFDASDPNAYSATAWAPYDALVRAAAGQGLVVSFELTGGAPRWADGKNPPRAYRQSRNAGWMPNARLYGQFVHAVTKRYDGHFQPRGASGPLPAVRFWSLWNEPNFGTDLGPQTTTGSTAPVAPTLYRSLLDAAWTALHQTGHGHDTVLIGELDPSGYSLRMPGHPGSRPGIVGPIRPLAFLRALYCLDDHYRRLQGSVARLYSCPATAAGSRRFRAQNPILFEASGFAAHPYSFFQPPDADPSRINRDDLSFPVLGRVATALDQLTKAYRSGKHFPIYSDEYGYITRPPDPGRYPSPAKAAAELTQAEYLSYKNRRIASYDQYLISDPPIVPGKPPPGFNTGLYTSTGRPKATLAAYRLPLWLPETTVKAGARTEIWGGARPATFSRSAATKTAPTVEIQMQKNGRGKWTTIQTVKVSTTTGYFDVHPRLPYRGNLRLAYTYPQTEPLLPIGVAGSTVDSRTVRVAFGG